MSMILEAVTMIADALGDPEIGVNAQLMNIPRMNTDGDDPPEITFIGDEFRDDRVVLRQPPPDVPAIYVIRDGPLVMNGEVATVYRDVKIPVSISIRVFTPFHSGDAHDTRYNEYYGRAVMRALFHMLDNENYAGRIRNGILIISCDEMLWAPMKEDVGGVIITGVVGITLFCRDTAP